MPDMSQFDVSGLCTLLTIALILNVQGTATMKMPEVRRFKKKFSSGFKSTMTCIARCHGAGTEVLTSAFWGANMMVGTKNGLFLLDRSGGGEIYPLVKGRQFRHIDVIESLGVAVVITGKKDKVGSCQ